MKRPRGVTIIGCLLLLQGLVGILTVGALTATRIPGLVERLPSQVVITIDASPAVDWRGESVYTVVALLALVGGFELLLMRPWAWTVAMLIQGYALVIDLWSSFQGQVLYLQTLLAIVIVFYLNTREVRRVFQARLHPVEDAPPPDAVGVHTTRSEVEAETTPQSVPG